MANHRSHVNSPGRMEDSFTHSNLEEHIKETVGCSRCGKWRDVENAGSVVRFLLDLAQSLVSRIKGHAHWPKRTDSFQIQLRHFGINLIQTIPIGIARFSILPNRNLDSGRAGEVHYLRG